MENSSQVRVRFAPSPTGYLHVGGLRTALYNYLFARKNNGIFVLRIEDTDRSRYVEGAVDNIINIIHWAGLEYDEGPGVDGPYAPYFQSERLNIYRDYVKKLLDMGKAYRCFCTPERLDKMRKEQERMGMNPKYDGICVRLTREQISENLEKGIPFVVRMKIPENEIIRFNDIIRNTVEFSSEQLDDQVLLKSDGYPTYHLANVVDDHLMKISHVIRGEEWLSSTPKHVLLYQYFGWELPKFAHLPLLLNPDRSKLSKRHSDVAVEDYRNKGYLKEALINFIALLGWNPGTDQEFFSMEELISQFSLERINKAGAIFNIEKLNWLNAQHLRKKSDQETLQLLKEEIKKSRFKNIELSDDYLLKVIQVMRERVSFIKDFLENGFYFFEPPSQYDPEVVTKRWKVKTNEYLKRFANNISILQNPNKQDYETTLINTAKELNINNSELIHTVRLAVTGVGGGPGIYDILFILGKEECIERINKAIEKIKPLQNG